MAFDMRPGRKTDNICILIGLLTLLIGGSIAAGMNPLLLPLMLISLLHTISTTVTTIISTANSYSRLLNIILLAMLLWKKDSTCAQNAVDLVKRIRDMVEIICFWILVTLYHTGSAVALSLDFFTIRVLDIWHMQPRFKVEYDQNQKMKEMVAKWTQEHNNQISGYQNTLRKTRRERDGAYEQRDTAKKDKSTLQVENNGLRAQIAKLEGSDHSPSQTRLAPSATKIACRHEGFMARRTIDEAIKAAEQRIQSEYAQLLDGKHIEIDRLRALYDGLQNRCDDLQTRCDNLQHDGDKLFVQGMERLVSMQSQIDQGAKTIKERDAKLQFKNQEIVAWTSSYERIPETRRQKQVVENLKYKADRLTKTVSKLEKRCKRGKEIEKRGPVLKYPNRTILVYINTDKKDQDRDAYMTGAELQANSSVAASNTTSQQTASILSSQRLHAPLQQSQAPPSANFTPQYAQQDGQTPNQIIHQSLLFPSNNSFPNGPSLPLPRISLEHGIHGFEQFSIPKTCSMNTCKKCYPDIVLPVAQRIFSVDFLPTGPAPSPEPMPLVPVVMITPVAGHVPAATDNFFLAIVQQLERGLVMVGSSTKGTASSLNTPAADTKQQSTSSSKYAPSDQSNALAIQPSALRQTNNSEAAPSTSEASPPPHQPHPSASRGLPTRIFQDSPHSATSKSHSPPCQSNTSTPRSTVSTGDGYEMIYGLKIRNAPPKPGPAKATPKVTESSPLQGLSVTEASKLISVWMMDGLKTLNQWVFQDPNPKDEDELYRRLRWSGAWMSKKKNPQRSTEEWDQIMRETCLGLVAGQVLNRLLEKDKTKIGAPSNLGGAGGQRDHGSLKAIMKWFVKVEQERIARVQQAWPIKIGAKLGLTAR